MSTIPGDVQTTGSTITGALSQDEAAAALLKRWEDQEKPASKATKEAADETSDETDEASADTESDDQTEETDEGDADPDAETEDDDGEDADEEKKSASDASDDAEVTITVDGEERRVSVKDLKRLYGQEASLTRKSQAVAAKQKEYEETTTKYVHALSSMTDKAMQRWKPYSEIDWAVAQKSLNDSDFANLRQQAKSAFDEAKFLTEELNGTMKGAQDKYMSSLRDRATDTIKVLQDEGSQYHIPNWSNTVYDDIRTFATGMGMAQSVVDTLVEPAAIKIIHMAMQASKAKAVATKKVAAAAPKKVLTSKKAPAAEGSTNKSKARAALSKAQKSGKLDDAAAAFMAKWS
jgi:hypothetical protein